MGTFIVEIRNPANDADRRLLVWSSRVDAPITYGMTEAELTEYVRAELGESGVRDLPERLARVRDHGTSLPSKSWVHAISINRAGPNETCLTPAEIWTAFADPPQGESTQAEQPAMMIKVDTEPVTVTFGPTTPTPDDFTLSIELTWLSRDAGIAVARADIHTQQHFSNARSYWLTAMIGPDGHHVLNMQLADSFALCDNGVRGVQQHAFIYNEIIAAVRERWEAERKS